MSCISVKLWHFCKLVKSCTTLKIHVLETFAYNLFLDTRHVPKILQSLGNPFFILDNRSKKSFHIWFTGCFLNSSLSADVFLTGFGFFSPSGKDQGEIAAFISGLFIAVIFGVSRDSGAACAHCYTVASRALVVLKSNHVEDLGMHSKLSNYCVRSSSVCTIKGHFSNFDF